MLAAEALTEAAEAELAPRPTVGVDLAAIEARPLGRIGQEVIGLADLLEALLGSGVAGVAIGMQDLGELAIGLLDRRLIGAARHVQDTVGIAHGDRIVSSSGGPRAAAPVRAGTAGQGARRPPGSPSY